MPDAWDDPAPVEPVPPDDSQCCGSGCAVCVWTAYFADQTAYRQALADWQARQAARQEGLNG